MKLRIRSTSAGEQKSLERVLYVVLAIGVLLIVLGMTMGTRRPPAAPTPAPAAAVAPAADPPSPPPPPVVTASVGKPSPLEPVLPRLPKRVVSKAAVAATPAPVSDGRFHLRGGGGMVVMAYEEKTAADLRKAPKRLPDLVQQGLLFTAPGQAAVAIEERRDGLVKVRILDLEMRGRAGWVRDDQVAAK